MARVAITGASGLLGGNLAAELAAARHTVVATKRGATKLGHLDDVPIEWRDADLGSVDKLASAFAGCEAVFHCAAAVSVERVVTNEMRDTNVGGTERVIEACKRAGVKRLVHTSSVVAIGLTTNGQPSDETAEWNFDREGLLDAYAITKHEAEVVVQRASIDAVIVNPTYMIGPRDARPSSGKLVIKIAKRQVPGSTPGYNNFVDVRDVARGMITAWQTGKRGERYILGGHDMTYGDFFGTVARVAGVKPPPFKIPYRVAKLVGRVGDFIEARGKEPLTNSTQIDYAYTDKFRFTSQKAQTELGYTCGPIEPAIRDALDWFRAKQML